MRWHVKALCERAAVHEDCVLYANMPLEVVHSAKAAPAAAVAELVGGGREGSVWLKIAPNFTNVSRAASFDSAKLQRRMN
ncbi:uncharacterized [Tachysurus ichikawai]